jgi:hypothetical protein
MLLACFSSLGNALQWLYRRQEPAYQSLDVSSLLVFQPRSPVTAHLDFRSFNAWLPLSPSRVKSRIVSQWSRREIESIFTIKSKHIIDAVGYTIFTTLSKSQGREALASGFLAVGESKTRHLRYSIHQHSGDEKPVFVIHMRERDGFITLKQKGSQAHLEHLSGNVISGYRALQIAAQGAWSGAKGCHSRHAMLLIT